MPIMVLVLFTLKGTQLFEVCHLQQNALQWLQR